MQRARAPEGDSLIDQAAGNLLRLVTVRPVGADVEGDDAAARVARAEARLAEGDLAAAVAEVEALEGAAGRGRGRAGSPRPGAGSPSARRSTGCRAGPTELLTPSD